MKEVSVEQLKEMMDEGKDFQLIDIREKHERDLCDIGGDFIPMQTIPDHIDKISKDKQVIVYCRSGGRSSKTISMLEQNYKFENLYNLKGGILAWADEIDDTIPKY